MNKSDDKKIYQNEKTRITINEGWCKSCGICVQFCPKKVLESDERGFPAVANINNCIHCMLCELRCPDFAINVQELEKDIDLIIEQKGSEA